MDVLTQNLPSWIPRVNEKENGAKDIGKGNRAAV